MIHLGLTADVAQVIRSHDKLYFDIMIDGKSVYDKLQPLTASPYAIRSSYSLSGVGSPVDVISAPVGASYVDRNNKLLYMKTGLTNSDWTQIGN